MKVLLLCILYVVFAYGKTIPVNEATINENSDVVPEKDTANRSKRDTYYKQHTYPSRTSDQYPGYDQSRRDGPGYERFPDPHQLNVGMATLMDMNMTTATTMNMNTNMDIDSIKNMNMNMDMEDQ